MTTPPDNEHRNDPKKSRPGLPTSTGGMIVAGVAALVSGEKSGQGGIPKNIIVDGPVVTKANAPGMMWIEGHYLI